MEGSDPAQFILEAQRGKPLGRRTSTLRVRMQHLDRNDYQRLLRAVEEVQSCDDLAAFPEVVLRAVGKLVSADWIGFDHIAPTLRERWMVPNVPLDLRPHHDRVFVEHLDDHPIIAQARREENHGAAKFSDFVSHADWRRTVLYNELYRDVCGEHQLAVPITKPGRDFYGLAFYRSRRDFEERDREMLDRLRPHLRLCFEKARALQRASRTLAEDREAYEAGGRFLLWVDAAGRLARATAEARRRLRAAFPEWGGVVGLPDALLTWLAGGRAELEPLVRDIYGVRVTVRRLATRPQSAEGGEPIGLLLEERVTEKVAVQLDRAGLRPREIEVLGEVEQGKTNDEIAVALGISPLTVKKHLENIYSRLGVRSRAEAVGRMRKLVSG